MERHQKLAAIDRRHVWHPFTQMSEWESADPLIVERAEGNWLVDPRGRRYLDGVSSLWVNVHGHRHPALDRALKAQVDRVAHSTLLGAASIPSIELARELTRIAPKGLTRVFYSDSGSTAVEVALKMAYQYWAQNGQPRRKRFVHFTDAYHGDTIGSVSVGGIDLFHATYRPLLFKGHKLGGPGDRRASLKQKLAELDRLLKRRGREVAALVVEPLVQGAGGMQMQPAGWLKGVERLCRKHDIFLIADEVAVGFGRTGTMFACEQEKVRPDFLCLAKGLTGGYLPVAATLTTERVYRGFLGDTSEFRTFFHGHSYGGNALGCAVALENLKLFRRERILSKLPAKIRQFTRELAPIKKLPHVGEVRQKGLMAGIELVASKRPWKPYPLSKKMGILTSADLRERGILVRPLGSTMILMPPLSITPEELAFLCRETLQAIRRRTEL